MYALDSVLIEQITLKLKVMTMKAAAQRKVYFHPNANNSVCILGCRVGFMD